MLYYEDEKLKEAAEESNQVQEERREVIQKSMQNRVTIEEPKDEDVKFTFNTTYTNFTIMLSIVAIAIFILAKLFAISGVPVVYTIFSWIGAVALVAAMAIYILQIVKVKKVVFEPQLVILILAIVCSVF